MTPCMPPKREERTGPNNALLRHSRSVCWRPGSRILRLVRFALAEGDDVGGIDSFAIELHLHHLAFFIDYIINATRGLVLRIVETVLADRVSAPVAQQRKRDLD